jgi:hypothetical protein
MASSGEKSLALSDEKSWVLLGRENFALEHAARELGSKQREVKEGEIKKKESRVRNQVQLTITGWDTRETLERG